MRLGLLCFAAVILGLLLVVPAASACHVTVLPNLGSWEDKLMLHVEAKGTSGFLSQDAGSGDANSFTAMDVASGPSSSVQAHAWMGRTTQTLRIDRPLAQQFFLNVSKPIIGLFYYSSTVQDATGREGTQFRVELFNGDVRVGGDDCVGFASAAAGKWGKAIIRFRPETHVLQAGDLSLRITRVSGTSDLRIGTGGAEQSYLEVHGYPVDPLSGALYMENRKLVGLPGGSPDAAPVEGLRSSGSFDHHEDPVPFVQDDGADRAPYLPSVFALALLGLGLRSRSRKSLLVAAMVFSVGVAGCLGGGNGVDADDPGLDEDAPAKPTVIQNHTADGSLGANGTGAVRGMIRDENDIPVRGAHVVLLGTNLFADTDGQGQFRFENVSAGEYLMRVDRSGFEPLEKTIRVLAGQVTSLEVRIVRPGNLGGGFKPHTHDVWGDETKKEIWNAKVVPSSGIYSATESAGYAYCPWFYAGGCEAPIPINYDQPVPPGATMVEIVLRWSPPAVGANELGLRLVSTGGNKTSEIYTHRPPGEPFRITFFPNEADPGHQSFTEWQLNVRGPGNGQLAHPFYPLVNPTGEVSVTATAYKGVVPYEPSHQDFWQGRSEITLLDQVKKGPGACHLCDYPYLGADTQYWPVTGSAFVPPGTSEVRGTMTWENPTTANQGTSWSIAYKPANSPAGRPVFKKPTTVTPSANKIEFVIKVDPLDTDQFYQTRSNWIFYPDDQQQNVQAYNGAKYSPNTGSGTSWTLTATAYRDPAYKLS